MEDHLGEQLVYLEESQCIFWKINLEYSCFTWKRASASYGRSTWRTAVLPGRELVHLIGRSTWRTAVLPGREPMHLMENHLGEPCKDDEHSDH